MGSDNTSSNNNTNNLLSTVLIEELDPYIDILQDIIDRAVQLLIEQLPTLQNVVSQAIDTIFIPKVIGRQIMVLIALETGMVTINQLSALVNYVFVATFSSKYRLIRQLQYQQRYVVSTQDEWMDIAERIDMIQGNDVWRSDPNCPLYERDRIQARIDEYVHLMRRRDIFELMFLLRGSIGRNKFGLLHEGLFTKALAGSKVLTETYHNVVCAALDFVCDAPVLPEEDPIPTDARLAFFNETRHAYGRTALLLSGGAALGFYHVGLVKALMENGLMPRVIGGSSAGSIVCAMIGTRTDQECLQDLFEVKGTTAPGHSSKLRMDFFRPLQKHNTTPITATPTRHSTNGFLQVYYNTAGAFHDAKRTIQGFMPLTIRHISSFVYDLVTGNTRPQDVFKNDTAHFRDCVRANVGDFTFQEAFDRTGRILNIVVTPNNSSDPPRLLNYLTAPHVMVWSAAVASSSLPGVFEANRLVVKEADGWERYESSGSGASQQVFSDGSMEQDLPMQQLSEMFNINHFIISQANPHAVLFASYTQKMSVWSNPVTGFVYQILTFLRNQLRSWLLNLVQCVGARRITPLFETQRGIGTQFFTQEYEGRPSDISLVPWLGHRGVFSALLHIIYNPSEAEFREWIQSAERETWKYIPAIKSHIAEEVTLDRCVQRLRRRLLHESYYDQQQKHHIQYQQQLHPNLALQAGTHLQPQPLTTSLVANLHHHHNNTNNNNENGTTTKDGSAIDTGRVPSFFTSHSLVNLSGLSVGDQQHALSYHPQQTSRNDLHESVIYDYAMPIQPILEPPPIATVVANNGIITGPGWGGLGLRGNRSLGNLHRNLSDASGLYIDAPNNNNQQQQQQPSQQQQQGENYEPSNSNSPYQHQDPGESTGISTIITVPSAPQGGVEVGLPMVDSNSELVSTPSIANRKGGFPTGAPVTSSSSMANDTNNNNNNSILPTMSTRESENSMNSSYVKTSSMARFYYRKSGPGEDYLQQNQPINQRHRANSLSALVVANSDSNLHGSLANDNSSNGNLLSSNHDMMNGGGTDGTNTNDTIISGFYQPSRPLAMTKHNRRKSKSYTDLANNNNSGNSNNNGYNNFFGGSSNR